MLLYYKKANNVAKLAITGGVKPKKIDIMRYNIFIRFLYKLLRGNNRLCYVKLQNY